MPHTSTNSQRTRHFFNGLTEEIRKVSLGTHADTNFTFCPLTDGISASGWTQGVGSGAAVTSVDDATRFSKVLKFNGGGRFDRSFSACTERAFSFWFKHELNNHSVVLWATTSAGARRIVFSTTAGTDGSVDGDLLLYYRGTPLLNPNGSGLILNPLILLSKAADGAVNLSMEELLSADLSRIKKARYDPTN